LKGTGLIALLSLVDREFEGEPLAREVFARFLGGPRCDRDFVELLVGVAAGCRESPSWALRRAATLILETLLIREILDESNHPEIDAIRRNAQTLVRGRHTTSERARVIDEAFH
jgi:hypothetical protein